MARAPSRAAPEGAVQVAFVTAPDLETAAGIARALVAERLGGALEGGGEAHGRVSSSTHAR